MRSLAATLASRRALLCAALACALGFVALRAAALLRVAFNWDELVVLHRAASSLREGVLYGGGHPGLTELLLLPFVAGCEDEIAAARAARGVWLLFTLAYLAGIGALLAELLRGQRHRLHDAALGVALLGALPVFLEWSLQVRTDHLALACGSWGAWALVASQRRPGLALMAGLAFGLGWLSSQKVAYVGALAVALAAARPGLSRRFELRRESRRAALAAGAFAALLGGYHLVISALFALPESHSTSPMLESALASKYIDVFEFYRRTIGYSQYRDIAPTLLPHVALVLLLCGASGMRPSRDATGAAARERAALAWIALAVGLGVGLFHAAAFSYFWMTLGLFPAVAGALALGPARDRLLAGRIAWQRSTAALLWLAVALPGALASAELLRDTQSVQRESLAFVRRNFAPSDAGFHPESGLFCSAAQPLGTWFSQTIFRRFEGPQRERAVADFRARFADEPVYYLVDSFRLNQFPESLRDFWAANYQPYRASVFVAGRRLTGGPGEAAPFEIVAPGRYRWLPLEEPRSVEIDRTTLAPGAVIALDPGPHVARFPEAGADGMLVLAVDEPPGPAPLAFYKRY